LSKWPNRTVSEAVEADHLGEGPSAFAEQELLAIEVADPSDWLS